MNEKLQKLLNQFSKADKEIAEGFSVFDTELKDLKEKLKKSTPKVINQEIKEELNKIREDLNFTPLLESLEKVKSDFSTKITALSQSLDEKLDKNNPLPSQINRVNERVSEEVGTFNKKLEKLQKDFNEGISTRKTEADKLSATITRLFENTEKNLKEETDTLDKKIIGVENTVKLNKEEADKLAEDFRRSLKELYSRGGGSMNRQIRVNGTDVLTKYTDINLIGTGISAAVNDTKKRVDITITSGGTGNGLVHPTTGSTYESGEPNAGMTGTGNTFIGVDAGDSITSGSNNSGLGTNALTALTTGSNNFAIGANLTALTTGSNNGAAGTSVFNAITSQSGNIGFGRLLGNAADSTNAQFFGLNIGNNLVTSSNVTAMGGTVLSGASNVVATDVTAIGIAVFSGRNSSYNTCYAFGEGIWGQEGANVVQSAFFGNTICYGAFNSTSTFDTMMGVNIISNGTPYTGSSNTLVGSNIALSGNAIDFVSVVVIGATAAPALETGGGHVIIGDSSAGSMTGGTQSIVIGSGAGGGLLTPTGVIAIGTTSMANGLQNSTGNIGIGVSSMANTVAGDYNTAIGYLSLVFGDQVDHCISIGNKSLFGGGIGQMSYVIAIGDNNGTTAKAPSNIILLGNETEPSADSITNEMDIGSATYPITQYYLGWGGQLSNTPAGGTVTIEPTASAVGGSGATLHIQGGSDTTRGIVQINTGATFNTANLTVADPYDIVLGTSTGTKIGTSTSQKLAFYNSTPIVQPGATTDLGTVLSNLGLRASGTAYPITTSGALTFNTKISTYNSVATTGWGVPAIYSSGRATAQTAANTSVATYTVGGADGSFEVSANVLVTTATLHNFTVTCDYTDEGNTARTVTMPFSVLAGTFVTAITNASGAVPYEGIAIHLRCKASTAITIKTAGTFTTVTYNVEGSIRQIA